MLQKMLSMIDEYDLEAFIDEERKEPETKEPIIIYQTVEPTDPVIIEPEKTESGNNGMLIGILIVAAGGVGTWFYFKMVCPAKDEESSESEGMEMAEEEEEED